MPQPPDFQGFAAALRADWRATARPEQLPPSGDWTVWVFCAGRGSGKTRSGAEWVRARVEAGIARRIHLVAPTAADCRDVLIEGASGLLSVFPANSRPVYSPSLRKIEFVNGAQALLFSADEPDRLRGPQCDTVWIDELCAMKDPQAVLDMALLGLRLGRNPQCLITTTPRPIKPFKALIERDGQDVVVTRCSTMANAANLARPFLSQILQQYQGTRLGRQELEAELLLDTPGALWTIATLDETRVATAPGSFQRIVVGVDPSGSAESWADQTGIVACGVGHDGHGYVLRDASGRYTPVEWARAVAELYRELRADRVVVERNFGGDMVAATIASVDPAIPVKTVTSSRGKILRAEPIASLFEQRRAHLVGNLPALEDQLTSFTHSYDRSRDGSPDRLDAMVFALTELCLGQPVGGLFREAAFLVDGEPVEAPRFVDDVYSIAVANLAADTLGVIHFATTPHADLAAPLTILDWDIIEAEQILGPDFLPEILARGAELAAQCARTGRTRAPLFVEPGAFGDALLQLGEALGLDVQALDTATLPADLASRANAARSYVLANAVKIARPAYDKVAEHRGVTRNHLLAQLAAFGLDDSKAPSELAEALVVGILAALQGRTASALTPPQSARVEVRGPASAPPAAPSDAVAFVARCAQFEQDYAAWDARRVEALARIRKVNGLAWRPTSHESLGLPPPPRPPHH